MEATLATNRNQTNSTFHTSQPFTNTLQSELTKFRSVKSSFWSLIVANGVTIVLSAIICEAVVNRWNKRSLSERILFDPTTRSLTGIVLAQLAIGVLGVLLISAEYSSGTIRATFAATPNRTKVLTAKAVVFAVITYITCLISVLIAFGVGQAIFTQVGVGASIGQPGVLRVILMSALYLTIGGLFALGLGTLVRHTAGGITAFVVMMLVLPGIVGALPSPWSSDIGRYLPNAAGLAMTSVIKQHAGGDMLGPLGGLAVFCGWAALALVVGGTRLVTRDA